MSLLQDILIIFALSVLVIFLFHRIKVPVVVGLFVTGILTGPNGLGLVNAVHEVEMMAEIGIVMLLFTIGIEFSLQHLMQIKRAVLLGGSAQVLLTVAASAGIVLWLERSLPEAVFIGFLVALSSTAIVLKQLQSRGEIVSQHGRAALAMLIFQDLIVVPMMLFTPLLASGGGNAGYTLMVLALKSVVVLGIIAAGARWVVPWLLHRVAMTRSRELFLLTIILICLAVAWLTYSIGLSLALGAFLAGLVISESEYSHYAFSNVVPFRDLFTSFFFVSIGMLLDLRIVLAQPEAIVVAAVGIIALKFLVTGFAGALTGLSLRASLLGALALAQIGEFSFILSTIGVEEGLITRSGHQIFLAVSVLTMALTPVIIAFAPKTVDLVHKIPIPGKLREGIRPLPQLDDLSMQGHLIIVGFGVNGRNVARAARAAGIPYVILEMNPDTVRTESRNGEPILFGDATHEDVLLHVDVKHAHTLVVAIPDAAATQSVTGLARKLNPNLHIIVRTRFVPEVNPLYKLGANEVIPEEFETSVEIFSRVLRHYSVAEDEIGEIVARLRADCYEMFRGEESP